MHSDKANLTHLSPTEPAANEFGAKGAWTSGQLVPAAKGVAAGPQQLELALSVAQTAIVATDEELTGLATLLSHDIYAVSGLRLNATGTAAKPAAGDVSFSFGQPPPTLRRQLDGSASTEWYSLVVDGHGVAITCASYTGCAWGATTLLQTLCVEGVDIQELAVPAMEVHDHPDVPYRAALLDTARSLVSIQDLYQAVNMVRFYKIPFLHLHLTDDHGWTFPSAAFPQLSANNVGFRGRAPVVFNATELKGVVKCVPVLHRLAVDGGMPCTRLLVRDPSVAFDPP